MNTEATSARAALRRLLEWVENNQHNEHVPRALIEDCGQVLQDAADAAAAKAPKWKCPRCGSAANVQVCLPAWHTETEDGELTYQTTDAEADISAWYCEECNDSDHGEPARVNE